MSSPLTTLPGSVTVDAFMQGDVASGVADSGNPVKIATVYNSTAPTFSTGQRAAGQSDVSGDIKVAISSTSGRPVYQVGSNAVNEGELVAGTPVVTVNVNTLVGNNGNQGYITNDSSTAAMQVEISHTGATFTTAFTLKAGETFGLIGWDVSQIRLTRIVADCFFRVHCW